MTVMASAKLYFYESKGKKCVNTRVNTKYVRKYLFKIIFSTKTKINIFAKRNYCKCSGFFSIN